MKLSMTQTTAKRPYRPNLTIIFSIGIVSLLIIGAKCLLMESCVGRALLLLAREGFALIPAALFIGATLVVALWAAILARVWRQSV